MKPNSCFQTKNGKSNFRRQAKPYSQENGTLFYDHSKHGRVRVVKEEDKEHILRSCHSDPLAGHQGINRTSQKICERYYWPSMSKEIQTFVRACLQCQMQNKIKKVSSVLHPIPVADKAWSMIGIDLVGPLVETERGNKYIAVATDYLTKYPEVMPLKSKSAEDVSEFIVDIICRHGAPDTILTDRGREFCNHINDNLCDKLNIERRVTSPYHPQTNGLTERFNQTLCNSLVKYVNEREDNWDIYLNRVAFATRTSVQASTKQTPFFLTYARHPTLPVQLDLPTTLDDRQMTELSREEIQELLDDRTTTYVEMLQTRTDAKDSNTNAQKRQKKYYDNRNASKLLTPGQKVVLRNPKRIGRKGDKLVKHWKGPYTISDYKGKGTYAITELKTVWNIRNIKPFVEESHPPTQQTRQRNTGILRTTKQLPSRNRKRTTERHTILKKGKATPESRNLIAECSAYDLPNPRTIREMEIAKRTSPAFSLYVEMIDKDESRLDALITDLTESAPRKTGLFATRSPYDKDAVPAITLAASVLMKSELEQMPPSTILKTLNECPVAEIIQNEDPPIGASTLRVANTTLRRRDLRTLDDGMWLNDQVFKNCITYIL